jgi:triphosphatase
MLVDHNVDLKRAVPIGVLTHSAVGLEFRLRDEMKVSDAFRVVRQTLTAAVLENLSILVAGCAMDGVYQSRVSVRRLRAIYSLFKSTSLGARMQTIRAELKWLSDLLGSAREDNIVPERILQPIAASNLDVSGFRSLLRSFRMLQQGARVAVLTGLRTSRITQLGIELEKGLHHSSGEELAGVGVEFVDQERTSDFLAAALQSRLQALAADGRAIASLAHAQQHSLRIRAKKLRYMIEPFSELLPWPYTGEAIALLRAFQDALGDVNDGRVTRALILDCARTSLAKKGREGSLLVAAGVAGAECARHEAQVLSRAQAARDSLARLGEPFTGARLLHPAIGRIR